MQRQERARKSERTREARERERASEREIKLKRESERDAALLHLVFCRGNQGFGLAKKDACMHFLSWLGSSLLNDFPSEMLFFHSALSIRPSQMLGSGSLYFFASFARRKCWFRVWTYKNDSFATGEWLDGTHKNDSFARRKCWVGRACSLYNWPGPSWGPRVFTHACIFFGRLASDACMHFLDLNMHAAKRYSEIKPPTKI